MGKGVILHFTNIFSKLFGKFANYCFPCRIQRYINGVYVRIFKINLDEFDSLESYQNLNALFTRSLIKFRSFDKTKTALISPCDGVITEFGVVDGNRAFQIKGSEYLVSDFIKNADLNGFNYVNFYLSPSDYHRFHAPLDLWVKKVHFIDGKLFSVRECFLKKRAVFTLNKRVVLECLDEFENEFYFVAIGALNVGRIQINFAPEIANLKDSESLIFDKPIFVKKGDEIGTFLMGSSIVIFSRGFSYDLKLQEKVYFGEQIAKRSEIVKE